MPASCPRHHLSTKPLGPERTSYFALLATTSCAALPDAAYCSPCKLLFGTRTTSQSLPVEQLTTALRSKCAADPGGTSSGNFIALAIG